MARAATGTVVREGKRVFVRVTMPDGSRPRVPVDGVPEERLADVAAELARRAAAGKLDLSSFRATSKPKTIDAIAQAWFGEREATGKGVAVDRSRWRDWCRELHDLQPSQMTTAHVESVVRSLDVAVREKRIAWKTARNVWAVLSRFCRDLARSKSPAIRCLPSNPAEGVEPPDGGTRIARTYLYPSEMSQLLACADVPIRWRIVYALASYLYLRAGELDALVWGDVDDAAGIVRVRRANDRRKRVVKSTKGNASRIVPIEPALVPLFAALRGLDTARVCRVPGKGQGWRLREHLAAAGIKRAALFADGVAERPVTLHDLRASGITWLALAGVDALKIQRRAGHASFATTQIYIREAENLGADVGAPFGPLPTSFLTKIGAPDQSSGHSSERPSASTEEAKNMGKLSGTRGSNPWRNTEDQQVGEGARTIAGPGIARTRPDTLAPLVATLELWSLGATGTAGES